MAPFLGSSVLEGMNSTTNRAAMNADIPSLEAVKALHAVQEIISTYFAKRTFTELDSIPTSEPAPLPELAREGHAEKAGPAVGAPSQETADESTRSAGPAGAHYKSTVENSAEISSLPVAAQGTTAESKNMMAVTTPSPSPAPNAKPTPKVNPEQLRSLAAEITNNIDQITSSHGPDAELARQKIATAALELSNSLRPPPEVIMNWFSTASVVSAVRTFMDWGVFDLIPAPAPGGPQDITFAELAEKIEAEESLLVRMSWMLTSTAILRHIPGDSSSTSRLAHTPTSLLLRASQPMAAMFKVLYTNIVEVSTVLPQYFASYGRREPLGPAHIPTSFLAGEPDMAYFEHINADPDRLSNFMRAMSITHRSVPTTGMYDMTRLVGAASADPSRAAWVDIGGGDGHTVKIFCAASGLSPSQCVVQDLPEVVAAAEEHARLDPSLAGMRFVPLDFHSETPVPGAMRYYLRHILRDYSDPTSITILRNLARALTAPDARILVAEQIATEPPPVYAAFKDYTMLAIGGKERTLEQFAAVADAAGLEISGVHRDKGTPHAVIEMKLKGSESRSNGEEVQA